ncbi:prealbumin-like fold domain-containing protein [Bifidobacterium myosotis]|uniref:LPXTG cell wall anchor domain-containing protein n=1 Tax=Bifidobacterium myosotis TaxID=1630166 RepID=A0A5M9ZLW0_9BIFI|nr:prealbumin-like fold domain-containing protein [Bifidobacterium myosotis]KAA8828475.1 LPXTG cell wall anchor domain-containing protein [Bifidobacterium myosotis]
MKMRKLFAGVAAAATLLSGMTLGAVAANAVDNNGADSEADPAPVQQCVVQDGWGQNTTITITANSHDQLLGGKGTTEGSETPRNFKVVKIADYKVDANSKQLSLETLNEVLDSVRNALKASAKDYDGVSDPMQWVSFFLTSDNSSNPASNDGTVRKFVDELTSDASKYPLTFTDPTNAVFNPNDDRELVLTVPSAGLYLIEDGSTDLVTGKTLHKTSRPMLVGTKIAAQQGDKSCLDNADGAVNLKASPEGSFEFTKVNRKGEKLKGAKFVISKDWGDGTIVYGRYDPTNSLYAANDGWDWARFYPTQNGPGRPNPDNNQDKLFIFTSDDNGKVSFYNLPQGEYTITEVQAPAGYYGNDLPSFKITVTNQGMVTSYIGENDGDPHDLIQEDPTLGLIVINVRFELPHTGAAGIAAFFAIAALLGGAGVTVFLKSRKTKSMLNA